jgi:hypothetical protein
MNERKTRLTLELLEDRIQPSSTGLPWPSDNLTLSFAPDGTKVDGNQSSLFQTLGSQATTKAWETQILKAAQTWASVTNLNIGLVGDGGQPLGVAGLAQGDSRFGDIRVAAEPMGASGPLSIGSPYDPAAGTRSGDIVFNSSLPWGINTPGSYDIYTAALHEMGNALGLSENADPTSAMSQNYYGPVTGLNQGDIAAIQALYGAPIPDGYQSSTVISPSAPAAGMTSPATSPSAPAGMTPPVIGMGPSAPAGMTSPGTVTGPFATANVMAAPEIAADISAVNTAEYFKYTVPSYANSTITATVNTAGFSLLTAGLSVYTASGQLISSASATDPFSGNTTITLNNVTPGTVLYFEVDSSASGVFGMGGYRLKVDSGSVSEMQIAAIDAVLSGTTIPYTNFTGTSTSATAASMNQAAYQNIPGFTYATCGQLNQASNVEFFSLVTPATAPQALIFTVTAGWGSSLAPNLTVFDANGNVVNAQILSANSSGCVVQVLNPVANATYLVEVSPNAFAASSNDTGNYVLGVNYAATPIVLQSIVNDTLSTTDTTDVVSVQSTQAQLYHFVFSVNTGVVNSGVVVVMQLFDANANLVLQLACQDGNTVSADVLLQQGNYTVRFIGLSKTWAMIPTTAYSLLGLSLSAPMDPVPVNPTDPSLNPTSSPTSNPNPTQSATQPMVIVSDPVAAPILPPVDPNLLTTLTSP